MHLIRRRCWSCITISVHAIVVWIVLLAHLWSNLVDMYVIWIANILVIIAMAFLIGKKQTATLRRVYWPAFVVKIAAGLALGLVYKYYYAQGDTFPYFYDAVTLADLARRDVAEYISFLWTTTRTAQPNSTTSLMLASVTRRRVSAGNFRCGARI